MQAGGRENGGEITIAWNNERGEKEAGEKRKKKNPNSRDKTDFYCENRNTTRKERSGGRACWKNIKSKDGGVTG